MSKTQYAVCNVWYGKLVALHIYDTHAEAQSECDKANALYGTVVYSVHEWINGGLAQ